MILTFQQALLFAAASAVVIAAPGPDNLGTLGIGLSRGRRAAMAFGAGCALGCLTHTLWAAIGLTAILAASATAFTLFKLAGGAYLFYLGVLALRSNGAVPPEGTTAADGDVVRHVFRGFASNALNPKVALFFLAFLPQFVRPAGSAAAQIALLGLTFGLMTAAAFMTLGYFAGHVGAWLRRRPTLGRRLDRLTGILFISLGIRLVLQRR